MEVEMGVWKGRRKFYGRHQRRTMTCNHFPDGQRGGICSQSDRPYLTLEERSLLGRVSCEASNNPQLAISERLLPITNMQLVKSGSVPAQKTALWLFGLDILLSFSSLLCPQLCSSP